MSILDNNIDISKDSNRRCEQNVDGDRNEESFQNQVYSDNSGGSSGVKDWSSLMVPFAPENINELPPEVFQMIIEKFLKLNGWRKLLPFRLVSKYWRLNIDNYLASRHGFQYTGRLIEGNPPPLMNYHEINAMLSFYPNLKQLIVNNFTISDHLVPILRQNVPKIERLSLNGCVGLTWKGITILSVRFSQLTFIDVSNCELDENRLSILVENLQQLKVMNAINPGREVTGQCLSKLWPNMKDLWIGFSQMQNCNSALEALVSGHGKNLIHLGLIIANYRITDWSIITNNMSELKSLRLTFASYETSSLKEFAKLKNLEFLVLAENSRNESQSVLTDGSLVPVLRGCSKLKSLNIAGTKPTTLRITNYSITQISKWCTNIEQIRFLNAHNIDDEGMAYLATIPSLFVLHLSSMNNITDAGIKVFAKESKKIRNFRCINCQNVTENVVDSWIDAANNRPDVKIKLYLESMVIIKSINDIPPNLRIVAKEWINISTTIEPSASKNTSSN